MSQCRCGNENRKGQRRCNECHAEYMREWRKTHPLEGEARRRANCRSYAHVCLSRGLITRKPCCVCGAEAEMHHDDYSKPRQITWLCRAHHLQLHRLAGD